MKTTNRIEVNLGIDRARNELGWSDGTATAGGKTYRVQLKWFDEPSMFGIRNGRVSKLWVADENGTVINFDRGWDERPKTPEAKAVLKAILKAYN